MNAIRFAKVSKKFSQVNKPSVSECSFTVEEGEFVVLLGPSGCGKTTLLKMVNRLYEPTSGEIYLHERPITSLKVTLLRREIGYVIQQVGLFPHLTVGQNIAVVPKLLGWSRPRQRERVTELLTLIKLPPEEYRDRYPAQLSGGQQQRVGLARALAGDPAVLLMDEPFGAIDAITRTELQDEMLRLHRTLHKTVLFVTHDVEEALRLADKIVIMQAGQIIQFDTPVKVLTQPANEFVYDLVGASDMVRQLSLLIVDKAMVPLSTGRDLAPQEIPPNFPTIERTENLRRALSLILETGTPKLSVVDQGIPVGYLDLDQIKGAAKPRTTEYIEDGQVVAGELGK